MFSDDVFSSSAGLLAAGVRSANAIRQCIIDQFEVPVQIIEFVHEHLHLPQSVQTHLSSTGSGHNQLGKSALVGRSVPVHRQRFEVRLGPLNRQQFESLCPYDRPFAGVPDSNDDEKDVRRAVPNIAFLRLVDLIRSILNRPLDFDIRLEVHPAAVTPARLGSSRLGFDSWMMTSSEERNRDDPLRRYQWDAGL